MFGTSMGVVQNQDAIHQQHLNFMTALKSFLAQEGNSFSWESASLVPNPVSWNQNGIYFPLPQQWALTLLIIPVSSSAARNWKTWKNTHNETRNHLGNKKFNN